MPELGDRGIHSSVEPLADHTQFSNVTFSKHVLIDAANVLHAWPNTRALFKRDRETARAQLIQRLIALHDAESTRVTVVIDGRGPNLLLDHPSQQSTFTVIYTPRALTADDVIEQMVGRSAVPSSCEVATDDQAQRTTIEASGAIWLPTSDLLARVERAEKRLITQVTGINRTTAREWGRR